MAREPVTPSSEAGNEGKKQKRKRGEGPARIREGYLLLNPSGVDGKPSIALITRNPKELIKYQQEHQNEGLHLLYFTLG